MDKRAVVMSTAILFGFVCVAVRLADLMLLSHDRLSERAQSQYVAMHELRVGRGIIFDRRGRELAVNLEAESIYCNPGEVESKAEAAAALAQITGLRRSSLIRDFSSKRDFLWITRKLDRAAADSVRELDLKGVGLIPESKRYYPKGELAAHVIGFVGVDNQPLEGIELQYDKSLKGWEKSVQVVKDAKGRTLSEGHEFQTGGNSLVLTIDEGLQFITERALAEAMDKWQPASASAIMMDPFTGEILAMANMPTYDLNDPAGHSVASRRNRSLTDTYEPGSTFKLVVAAAALEEHTVREGQEFDASAGYIRVGGKAIWDTHNQGVLSFSDVIKRSSNVGAVMIGQTVDPEVYYGYIRKFGFGERTGIDLPGESPGTLRPPNKWSETSQAAMSIGYEVAVTPLQMLRAYSAVANGGRLVKPHVVSEVLSPDGHMLYRSDPGRGERAVSERTAARLKEIFVTVTQEGGTATGASVDGNRVAGKTGTARMVDPATGTYSKEKYSSSFVGFVPAENPRMALIVVMFEPKGKYYGGRVAAPVFKEIAEQALAYLNVPRDDNFEENVLMVKAAKGN